MKNVGYSFINDFMRQQMKEYIICCTLTLLGDVTFPTMMRCVAATGEL